MTQSRDDLISAFIDGELSDDAAAAFALELERDPELAARVEQARAMDVLLASAIREDIPDDSDPATLARFGLGDAAVVPLARSRAANEDQAAWGRWAIGAGGAIAAAFALVLLRPDTPVEPWGTTAFQKAMDGTASLQPASLDGEGELTPRLTFQAADGRFCREFALSSPKSARAVDGIACRNAGRWAIEAKVEVRGPAQPRTDSIELAGGDDHPELDAVFDKLGGSDPLGPADEARLIKSGWEATRK